MREDRGKDEESGGWMGTHTKTICRKPAFEGIAQTQIHNCTLCMGDAQTQVHNCALCLGDAQTKCTIARLCPDIAKIFQIHMCAIFFIWISFSTTCSCRNILKEMILRLQINRFLVWSPRWAQINRVLVWYFFTSALRHAAALATPCELYSQSPRELSSRELYSQSLKR